MYKKDFLPYLSQKDSSHFIIFGACITSVEYYGDVLSKKYNASEVLNIDFGDYDFAKCKEFLSYQSLFSEKKLLFIKSNKTPPIKDLNTLISLCDEDNKLIISLYDCPNAPECAKVTKNFVRFFPPSSEFEAIEFLHQISIVYGANLDKNDLKVIYESLNYDLFLSYCEINKYIDFKPSQKFIKSQCSGEFDIDFEIFFDDLLSLKNIEKNINSFLFLNPSNEIYVLNMLSGQFLRLFTLKLGFLKGLDVLEILGYNPPTNVINKLKLWANRLSINAFNQIISYILECEKQLKFEQKDLKKELLFSYILKIAFVISQNNEQKLK